MRIIDDILDFSKIEAGKLEIEEIPFDLRQVVEEVANSIAIRAEQKGLEFISFLPPQVPSELLGDPTRLRQILINLSGNAVKFTQKGEIYLKGEMIGNMGDQVRIAFSVKDTGIGIPRDKQKKIFESFTQADGSTTRQYGGTGLGTTISKQLVEVMGGEIGLESEEGKGSVFRFVLDFERQKERPGFPSEHIPKATGGLKVLVVDDNATNRFILTEYLRSWGWHSSEVSGGTEALSLLGNSESERPAYDLILTDFQMPEMDGVELSGRIRLSEAGKNIPIIMLTSAGNIKEDKTCAETEIINACLSKPIRRDALRKTIESILGLSAKESECEVPGPAVRGALFSKKNETPLARILLVEDYPTNQHVVLKHLRDAGYEVDLAENGREAVTAHKNKAYDLIFMDIQMPEMDGFEATEEIRNLKSEIRKKILPTGNQNPESGIQSPPIIAMTAHALKGYSERCLAAGMDDYIAKPLKRKSLLAMAEKWTSSAGGSKSETRNPKSETRIPEEDAPMDFERALREFEGDEAFLMEVLEGFAENVAKQIGEMREALSGGDSERIWKEAHSVKGGAANLRADRLCEIASELDRVGKSGALEKASGLLEELETELRRLEAFCIGIGG